ncbi:DUF664 domain-containing protein [Arthrobacter sp. A5]|uniref:mycothiol transferase n=1 Tax=Arthrobacter sp. A5 TaxID=576926 RepID=UPI003DA83B1C
MPDRQRPAPYAWRTHSTHAVKRRALLGLACRFHARHDGHADLIRERIDGRTGI